MVDRSIHFTPISFFYTLNLSFSKFVLLVEKRAVELELCLVMPYTTNMVQIYHRMGMVSFWALL